MHTHFLQERSVSRAIRWLAIFLGLALLFVWNPARSAAEVPPPPNCDWSGQQYDDFYTPPEDLGDLTPERLGEILRVEHIRSYTPEEVAAAAGLPSSDYGAEAYRILYLSQSPIGTAQAVSGLIVVPTGTIPEGGFPVIADAHHTTGLADSCAPSRRNRDRRSLLPWVGEGYLVSATDYVGLGTPGLHPYLVGESAAFSTLDSARAAQRFCDEAHGIDAPPAGNRIFLEGHSQGGHAVLFAHQEWQSYAPELNILGTVAFAPGSEGRYLAELLAQSERSPLVSEIALAMYAYQQYYGAPDHLRAWLQLRYAVSLPDWAENSCVLGVTLRLGFRPDEVFRPGLVTAVQEGRWDDIQPLTDYLDANTPGNYTSDVPVLVLQGTDDTFVPPEASQMLTERLCGNGTPTQLSTYEGVGHLRIAGVARPEALAWMADRLAGVLPAPDSCTN